MSNMNEEKEKAIKALEEEGIFKIINQRHKNTAYWAHGFGFDAGVLAERERMKNLIDEQVEDGYDHNSMFIANALYDELFPQPQEQEK